MVALLGGEGVVGSVVVVPAVVESGRRRVGVLFSIAAAAGR